MVRNLPCSACVTSVPMHWQFSQYCYHRLLMFSLNTQSPPLICGYYWPSWPFLPLLNKYNINLNIRGRTVVQNLANKQTLPKWKSFTLILEHDPNCLKFFRLENIIIKCITYLNDKAQACPCSNPGRVNFIFSKNGLLLVMLLVIFTQFINQKNWFYQTLASG